MNAAEFTHEAERLAKAGVLLRRKGDGLPVAYWHGIQDGKPCISFASGSRWLTVVLTKNFEGSVMVSDQPVTSSAPLFAEPYMSLPPVDAVFLFGSERIEQFLLENNWSRTVPFNANFRGSAAHEYERLWQGNCPLYRRDLTAVLGGWNVPWPDGDFEDLAASELLVWTLEEAEPWVEAFRSNGSFRVFQRIT